jgi:hypothetical protein
MKWLTPSNTLVSVFAVAATSGCATYRDYREWGSHGCPPDARITGEVRSLLDEHPELGNRVYVQTWDNVVYLSGRVTTDTQRDFAESLAHEPAGVQNVIDTMTVAGTPGAKSFQLAWGKCPVPKVVAMAMYRSTQSTERRLEAESVAALKRIGTGLGNAAKTRAKLITFGTDDESAYSFRQYDPHMKPPWFAIEKFYCSTMAENH